MKWTNIGNPGLCLGVALITVGAAAAQAATPAAKAADESQTAARLLSGIRADAAQVQSAAEKWENLTKSSTANWKDYDLQWNEIAPPVEDMQIKLDRLESMSGSLSEVQRGEVDQAKQTVQEIRSRTDQLISLLDAPGFKTGDMRFRSDTRNLSSDAGKVEKTIAAS